MKNNKFNKTIDLFKNNIDLSNIFQAQLGQLPPEAYQSQNPTVRILPSKSMENTFSRKYKTKNLPPKSSQQGITPQAFFED